MNKRLASLDVLRGIDMFLLAVVGPFVWCLNKVVTLPDPVLQLFRHVWGGFTFWDIIMPLFILFGQTSLLAYMCHGTFSKPFWAFGKIFAPGVAHLLGAWAEPITEWLAASLLLVAVLYIRRETGRMKRRLGELARQ